jgi:hypothetical protein
VHEGCLQRWLLLPELRGFCGELGVLALHPGQCGFGFVLFAS